VERWDRSLGEGTLALALPIGFWQNLDPQVNVGQATLLTRLQTPPGYRLTSVDYPLDKEAQHHPQGEINTFRIGPMFGAAPLVAVFADQLEEATKPNRLVFWSTLFGAAVAMVLEALLAIARRLLSETKSDIPPKYNESS